MSAPSESVNTKQVQGRRIVHYKSLDEFLEDAERLAAVDAHTIGNWSKGQIYEHLARSLNVSIDGGTKMFPAPMRLILNLFFKNKFLHQTIPAGFKAPSEFVPSETSVEDGLAALRQAVARQNTVAERALHPGFGKLTREEHTLFHLRHAEMHMSFIVD